jgi:hypothetical protein
MAKEKHNWASFECPRCGNRWRTDFEQGVKRFIDMCKAKKCLIGREPVESYDREAKKPKERRGKFDPSSGQYIPMIDPITGD